MSKRDERCENCKWWSAKDNAIFGICRGAPPSAEEKPIHEITIDYKRVIRLGSAIWPLTYYDDFCAVFLCETPREKEEKKGGGGD